MRQYIIRRLLTLIPVLILVSIFCFSLLHLIPGDPIDFMFSDDDLDDELVDASAGPSSRYDGLTLGNIIEGT